MTLIYTNEIFLNHDTGQHPENAQRLRSILAKYQERQDLKIKTCSQWKIYDPTLLLTTHTDQQIGLVRRLSQEGGGQLDADTVVSEGSYAAALAAVSAGCDAVEKVLAGKETNAMCLVRPPGHHATEKESMGFCLFNNIAVAANFAQKQHQVSRILIADFDVHHGNGTQDIFYESENVFFLSMHRFPFYPGTGDTYETGSGRGLGFTKNLPITMGTSRQLILEKFRLGLEEATSRVKPELVLISAGFDAHKADPIGSLGLETADYATMTKDLKDIAQTYCQGKIVSFLEGGYNTEVLPDCVLMHLEALSAD